METFNTIQNKILKMSEKECAVAIKTIKRIHFLDETEKDILSSDIEVRRQILWFDSLPFPASIHSPSPFQY